MNSLVVVAAADPSKTLSGGFGLLVFLVLVVVVVFLFRSMNRHLRKVRQIDFDSDRAKNSANSEPDSTSRPAVKAKEPGEKRTRSTGRRSGV